MLTVVRLSNLLFRQQQSVEVRPPAQHTSLQHCYIQHHLKYSSRSIGSHYNSHSLSIFLLHSFVSFSYFGFPSEISSRMKMYRQFSAELRSCKPRVVNFCSQVFMSIFLSAPVIALLLLSPLSPQFPNSQSGPHCTPLLSFTERRDTASHFECRKSLLGQPVSHSCTSTFPRYITDVMPVCNWLAARVLPSFGCQKFPHMAVQSTSTSARTERK